MCRKRVLAATVLCLGLASASPAFALFGGSKAKPAAAPEPAKPAPGTTAAKDKPADSAPRRATPVERAAADRLDPLAQAAFWAREVEADHNDVPAMVKLSRALRSMGRADEAVAIGQQMLVLKPDDRDALMEAGRANIAAGQAFYAVAPLEKARRLDVKDWRPVSLLGVAYEAVQRDADAAAAFAEAVRLAPDNPGALSNLAMFKAGRGETAEAETLLRRAAASPDATVEVRLNLALVLGMKGDLAEAETLLRRDLPPDQASANLAYLKSAGSTATQRNWNALQGSVRP